MKVGLYFGSFNPIHIGHLIIASTIINQNLVDQIWFVISPQNPLKASSTLLNEYHRLHLVNAAIQDDNKFKATDIEFKLPRPSFTIDTMTYLEQLHPDIDFQIIMGSDSFQNIGKWKNAELLQIKYPLLIYPRPGFELTITNESVKVVEAPLLEISASYIRALIKQDKNYRYMVPEAVGKEIEMNNYYK